MSQYSASSSPPVTAAPLMAPITGLVIGGHFGEMSGRSVEFPSSLRSSPAQNTGSAPVRITTSTASSASASRSAAKNCVRSADDSALRDCGRFSVRVRTRSLVSMSSTSSFVMASTYRGRYVPKHHRASRPGTGGDRRGDRGRRPPVRPQGQRRDPAVGGQRRRLRNRGRRGHRDDDTAAGRSAAAQAAAQDRSAVAAPGSAGPHRSPSRPAPGDRANADPTRAQGVERGGARDARRPPNRVAAQGRNSREEVHARLVALPVLPDRRPQPRRAGPARTPRPAGRRGRPTAPRTRSCCGQARKSLPPSRSTGRKGWKRLRRCISGPPSRCAPTGWTSGRSTG